ncbi:hypothetical protein B0H10DRAFT_1962145 [Mycena sp. CBHHK59/15]|nr:hypothetical protein B0H10DRAFT_1962145 [Mycena sp. CBHHK59/15]
MTDTELSDTSDEEEKLTPAQKARRTRAQNLNQGNGYIGHLTRLVLLLTAEATSAGGRAAKKTALKNKIWDPSSRPSAGGNAPARKRAASTTGDQQPKTAKKAKARPTSDNEMDIDQDAPAVTPVRKATINNTSGVAGESKTKKSKSKGATPASSAEKRKFFPKTILSDDEDDAGEEERGEAATILPFHTPDLPLTVKEPAKSHPKPSADAIPPPTKPRAKATKATSDEEDEDSNDASSQAADDDKSSDASLSGEDEELIGDMEREHPKVIQQRPKSAATLEDDDLRNFEDNEEIPQVSCRRYSSSSMGSIPPDTDFDVDADKSEPELDGDKRLQSPSPEVIVESKKKVTAQQAKYNQENPQIRASKVLHSRSASQPKVYVETDWPRIARLVFPATGGQIKLLEQPSLLKEVTKDAMELSLYEIAFKDGYEAIPSCSAFVSRLLRLCAKKHNGAAAIEKRAKKDTTFCGRLAPLICTRGSNLRTALRSSALSKVATHYELNKPGMTPSQIRSIVKQLFQDQCFIFPYGTSVPRPKEAPAVADDALAADVARDPVFNVQTPFLAPAIVDLIHETWWSSSKALGFKYAKKLKSHRADRPEEVVLPYAMICLATVNLWASLLAYSTGHYVPPPPEFNQARLEGMYKTLLDIMQEQRNGNQGRPSMGLCTIFIGRANRRSLLPPLPRAPPTDSD